MRYMFESRVPPWVRSFGLDIKRGIQNEELDPSELTRRIPRPANPARGIRYAVLAALVMAALVVLAEATARLAGLAERCVFPPCY